MEARSEESQGERLLARVPLWGHPLLAQPRAAEWDVQTVVAGNMGFSVESPNLQM